MTLVAESTPRQTIPYGDRPIARTTLRATDEFYQFLERLRVSTTATIQNITNIIVVTNANSAQIAALQTEVDNLKAILAIIEAEIAALQALIPTDTPPSAPPLPISAGFPPWPRAALAVDPAVPSPVGRFMVEEFLGFDFTNAPTADPGSGRVWLKVGNLHVGA